MTIVRHRKTITTRAGETAVFKPHERNQYDGRLTEKNPTKEYANQAVRGGGIVSSAGRGHRVELRDEKKYRR